MSDLTESLVAYMLGRSALQTLLGSDPMRLSPDALPMDEPLPAVQFFEIDDVSEESLNGAAGAAARRYQFDCFASTRLAANEVREALRMELQGYKGGMDAHNINAIQVAGRSSEYERPTDGSDRGRYLARIDFLVSYTEPAGLQSGV